MKKHLIRLVVVITFIGFITLAIKNVVSTDARIQLQDIQVKDTSVQLKQLKLRYNALDQNLDKELHQKNQSQENIKKLEEEKVKLQSDLEQAKKDLQAKLDVKNQVANSAKQLANAVTGTSTASAASLDSGIDCNNQVTAKAFIYCHESGNDPTVTNSGGCRGLGQACPGSKLPCSNADYACQDAYFTSYMANRYGTWEKAKAFWLARVPVNGRDVGNWW